MDMLWGKQSSYILAAWSGAMRGGENSLLEVLKERGSQGS